MHGLVLPWVSPPLTAGSGPSIASWLVLTLGGKEARSSWGTWGDTGCIVVSNGPSRRVRAKVGQVEWSSARRAARWPLQGSEEEPSGRPGGQTPVWLAQWDHHSQ